MKLQLAIFLLLCFGIAGNTAAQNDQWVATDALGRFVGQYRAPRKDRYVGVFYFIWHGAHGYDQHSGNAPDGGIMPKKPSDTLSPYDISKLLKANPDSPRYGPVHAFHYWGEPYFGYYLSDDEWVIRKHAQMLSDAGVDVVILDVTNAATYLPQVTKIAQTYQKLRANGISTPSLAFITNAHAVSTVNQLYEHIYAKGRFKDLWFYWKGKPLLLAPAEGQNEEVKQFFTLRQSWAWSKGQEWFGNGMDKWTWVDHTPQSYGWHESPDKPEQISVSIAEHPMSNIGRSFHDGREPVNPRSEKGFYFNEQWVQALAVDPEFIFITGWNEWVAMRFDDGASSHFLGKKIKKGETYFVDLYNEEYSRDAEPVNGSFGDNYYYQMTAGIRRFKGSTSPLVYTQSNTINIDGTFDDWQSVKAIYTDEQGDTFHRKHPGWGRYMEYVNVSGRNDIVQAKIAVDQQYISFYVKTAAHLSSWNSPDWMRLYLSIGTEDRPNWESFHFLVNAKPKSPGSTIVQASTGGWNWKTIGSAGYSARGNELELRIPRKLLGLTAPEFTLDFKWADNVPLRGQAMDFMDKGDSAPNSRFKYRFLYSKSNK
ncbi:hypothetical protein [Pedobacter sp. JY14-1]|uniref:hypothetical protein n=1 Tax=Pedobacter sp. JY14-1 TaxID=3034151 RepID=UPI0023E0C105|nr:hypothetical protein [Pedobacter sp. JY14-1]